MKRIKKMKNNNLNKIANIFNNNVRLIMLLLISTLLLSFSIISGSIYSYNTNGEKNYFNTNINIKGIFDSTAILKGKDSNDSENNESIFINKDKNSNNTNTNTSTNTNNKENINNTKDNGNILDRINNNVNNAINDSKDSIDNAVESANSSLVSLKNEAQKTMDQINKEYKNALFGMVAITLKKIAKYCLYIFIIVVIVTYIFEKTSLKNKEDEKSEIKRYKFSKLRNKLLVITIILQILPLIFAIIIKGWGK